MSSTWTIFCYAPFHYLPQISTTSAVLFSKHSWLIYSSYFVDILTGPAKTPATIISHSPPASTSYTLQQAQRVFPTHILLSHYPPMLFTPVQTPLKRVISKGRSYFDSFGSSLSQQFGRLEQPGRPALLYQLQHPLFVFIIFQFLSSVIVLN